MSPTRLVPLVLAASALSSAGAAIPEKSPAERMLEKIGGLTGDWQGRYEWTGARTGGGDLKVTYQTTGLGSAVIETLIQGGKPSMSTVYHVDGSDLRMTHYCGARNQPRLRADHVDPDAGKAHFVFVDATNINPDHPGHVHGANLHIVDANHLVIEFEWLDRTAQSHETITVSKIA